MKPLVAPPVLLCLLAGGCRAPLPMRPDNPHLNQDVRMTEIHLPSQVLARDVPIRILAPSDLAPNAPIVYLLHGADADFRDWSDHVDLGTLAAKGLILVMPDGGRESYYINDARGPGHRYEDFFFDELIPTIHRQFPTAATDRAHTAIVGISRGGYGATVFALHHPEAFSYVGGLSSAFDLPERGFRWRAPVQSLGYRKVFGPMGSSTRTANDPFLLIRKTPSQNAPYFYLSCGDTDVLFPTNRQFAATLDELHLPHEFHILPGHHDWSLWAPQLPSLEASLLAHFGISPQNPAGSRP